ncbi:hypothetical protein SMKI_09G0710 [Saccharomyces mikatae IFO 1815]|uniref:Uncharacterized protein n=1 Tax=Saccharomyces mikatae IFO 1815 TaxID=226126 RepID=A0AA35NH87_SACMI|nr:uncharacterized protein SMKI_09G0710 [Saccharomyces mikatae IFO 1815]CAI4039664.1 hypothetical protein SMKI_09G0710 [Saccharomyces mikatae IFO 1815]
MVEPDFIEAPLSNIDNSILSGIRFDYRDFEKDIGNRTEYEVTVGPGYRIKYASGEGFTVSHPDVNGLVAVDDALAAYRCKFNSDCTTYLSHISPNYLVKFSNLGSSVVRMFPGPDSKPTRPSLFDLDNNLSEHGQHD